MSKRELVGTVTHYFRRIGVAGVTCCSRLAVGDRILIIGHTTAFEQDVTSMELNHQQIGVAENEQEIGLRVIDKVRAGDQVYRLTDS